MNEGRGWIFIFAGKLKIMSAEEEEGPENKGAMVFATVYSIMALVFILGLLLFG